ncbi:MAG: hypothetical protein J7K17_02040 [Candidatus Omnitrophica bacterium]|nr:hypothetical protein [Candidatus Omnitrophota bacterium]
MRVVTVLALIGAGVSLILGIISRIMLKPVGILPRGVASATFLSVTQICLLIAIAFALLELIKVCKK